MCVSLCVQCFCKRAVQQWVGSNRRTPSDEQMQKKKESFFFPSDFREQTLNLPARGPGGVVPGFPHGEARLGGLQRCEGSAHLSSGSKHNLSRGVDGQHSSSLAFDLDAKKVVRPVDVPPLTAPVYGGTADTRGWYNRKTCV